MVWKRVVPDVLEPATQAREEADLTPLKIRRAPAMDLLSKFLLVLLEIEPAGMSDRNHFRNGITSLFRERARVMLKPLQYGPFFSL